MVLTQGQGIFKILLRPFTSERAPGSQIKKGPQTMVLIQGLGICWTTLFAEMILDWIRKVLE